MEWLSGEGALWAETLHLELLGRLVLAAVLGGMIGLEREASGKPAGFRTNLLICLGAALLTDLSIYISKAADPAAPVADPGRIAAQIVSGIGFLGAGTILQFRGSVVGLTTAATLWVVAAIGIAVGARAYIEAVGATALVMVALIALGRVEGFFIERRFDRVLRVTVLPSSGLVERIRDELGGAGYRVEVLEVERGAEDESAVLHAFGRRRDWDAVLQRLLAVEGVLRIKQG
jgi:putative Mg2+ transporter-C (MgtC) family protein